MNEGKVQDALNLPEPKVGDEYPPEKVKRYIQIIDAALAEMKNKKETDANDSIVQDLRDKKKKWQNVDKETKPTKTKLELPPDKEEPPPPPEEEEPRNGRPVEEKIDKYISEGKPKFRKDGRAKKIAKEVMIWPDWYFTDVPRNQLIKDLMKKFKLTKKKADYVVDTWGKYKEQRMSTGELEDYIHMGIQ
jgi:hypothetical protein